MFGMFKKPLIEDPELDWDNDVPPADLKSFMDDHKEMTLDEQLEVIMYQLDRIEAKIDQVSLKYRVAGKDEIRDF